MHIPQRPKEYYITHENLSARAESFLQTLQRVVPTIERLRIDVIRAKSMSTTDETTAHQTCAVGVPPKASRVLIRTPDSPLIPPELFDRRAEGLLNTLKAMDPSIIGIVVSAYQFEPASKEFISSYSKQQTSVGALSQANAEQPTPRITQVTHAQHQQHIAKVAQLAAARIAEDNRNYQARLQEDLANGASSCSTSM